MPRYNNPQDLNRFSYVLNNPIKLIDPTGHVSCFGSNWDDGPQCKKKNPDQYNVLKHPDHYKLTDKQKDAIKRLQQQIHACQQNPLSCKPYDGPSVNNASNYYVTGYRLSINLRDMDWLHITANGVGIVGDAATLAAWLDPLPVVDEVPTTLVSAGANTVGVAIDAYDILQKGDFLGSITDTALYLAQKTNALKRIAPVFGFGVHIRGLVEAIVPGLQQIPILESLP